MPKARAFKLPSSTGDIVQSSKADVVVVAIFFAIIKFHLGAIAIMHIVQKIHGDENDEEDALDAIKTR